MKGRSSFIDTLEKSVKVFVVNQCYVHLTNTLALEDTVKFRSVQVVDHHNAVHKYKDVYTL